MAQQILKLVKIGNSRGVRLPKELLAPFNEVDSFDATVVDGAIKLVPKRKMIPRDQWGPIIDKILAEQGDDADEFREWDVTLADGIDEL
jgi:antitoxin component of MazEF toxin-antitoxin module